MIDPSHKKYLLYVSSESINNDLKKTIKDFLDQEKLEKSREYKVDVYRVYKEYLPNGMTYDQFLRDSKLNELLKP